MSETITQFFDRIPFEAKLQVLFTMLDDVIAGRDRTLAALQEQASAAGVRMVVVGGVAVIRNGYERTTTDRDVLVTYGDAPALADRLTDHPDWERLEIRQYATLYRPTGLIVDFLVSRDLIQLGRPYYFPDVENVETIEPLAGIPVLGLHDLIWLKLLAGRMKDLADIMELCKRHLNEVDPDRVLTALEPEDDDVRQTLLDILRKAPIELANEKRLGQGHYPKQPPKN
jgi:hypothetical protein